MRIDQFMGAREDAPKQALPPGVFQIDLGSDRLSPLRWKRRKGIAHSTVPKQAAAIDHVLGFEIPGDFPMVTLAGSVAAGHLVVGDGPADTAAHATLTTLTPNHRASAAALKRMAYVVNGWDSPHRWNGRSSSFVLAGIEGPSNEIDSWTPNPVEAAGDGTPGLHLIRYRYLDSITGYVSEASEWREVEITQGNGKLTFPVAGAAPATIGPDGATGFTFTTTTIVRTDGGSWVTDGVLVGDSITADNAADPLNDGTFGPITAVTASTLTIASGGLTADTGDQTATFDVVGSNRIQVSSDSKVDSIVIEMSRVNDSDFFHALEVPNTVGTLAEVDISDPELEGSFLEWPSTGHLPPPVAKSVVAFRERLWLFGQVIHSTGNCDVTNGSVDVGEGSTDPDWRASALGDETATVPTYSDVTWLFQVDGDTRAYEVAYYDESLSKIVLRSAYQGTTDTDVSYKLFSRANNLWVSSPGYPEGFESGSFLDGWEYDLVAAIGVGSSLLIAGTSGMDVLSWDQGPLIDPIRRKVSRQRGALNNKVMIEADQTIYGMDHQGWWAWSGGAVRDIGRPMSRTLDSIDFSDPDRFHAVFLPKQRAVRWYVGFDGATYVQFDLETQTWSTGTYYQTMEASALVPTSEGLKVYLGDDQGYVWQDDIGLADGVDADESRATRAVSLASAIKLSNPTTLPAGRGEDVAWSPSGAYLAVAHSNSPFLSVYSLTGTTLTKLANPATLPESHSRAVAWSPDGNYLAVLTTWPTLDLFQMSAGVLTRVSSVAAPWLAPSDLAFSPDGNYLVACGESTPYLRVYGVSGAVLTPLTDPSTMPTGPANGLGWSPDSSRFSVGHNASPYVSHYSVSSSTVTKLPDPGALPTANRSAPRWHADGDLVVISPLNGDSLEVYSYASGVFSREAPVSLSGGAAGGEGMSWRGNLLTVGLGAPGGTPYSESFLRSGAVLTPTTNLPALTGGNVFGAEWSPNGRFVAFGVQNSPRVEVYDTLPDTVLDLAGVTLPTTGKGVDGAHAYHLASGEARRITANNSDQITLASAFTTAPSEGDVIWIGPIPAKLRTGAFTSKRDKKVKPRQVWVDFTPVSGTRYLQMRVYDSLSPAAKTWDTGMRNDPDGAVFPGNNDQYPASDWLIDLSEADGHVEINIGSEFRRAFEVEFEMREPDCDLEIISIEFIGVELGDEQ